MKTIQLLLLFVTLVVASCGNPTPETKETTETAEITEDQREFYQLKFRRPDCQNGQLPEKRLSTGRKKTRNR